MNKLSLCTRGLWRHTPRFSKTHSILPFLASRRREVETYDFPDQIKLRDDKPASSSDGCSR
uniref:Uncharacterized protein n=1 Tax=Anguilla anguilla TaxID=7936 RepID=A0A0E9Q504_ANGAN